MTPEERHEYMKIWRENNKEKLALYVQTQKERGNRNYNKEFYEKNKERYAANQKKWLEKNKEKQKAYQREYYLKNKERIMQQQKEYKELRKTKEEFTVDLGEFKTIKKPKNL